MVVVGICCCGRELHGKELHGVDGLEMESGSYQRSRTERRFQTFLGGVGDDGLLEIVVGDDWMQLRFLTE